MFFFNFKSFSTEGSHNNVTARLQAGRSEVRILPRARECFLFKKAQTVPGLSQPHVHCILVACSPGVRRPMREVEHSPPSGAAV